MKRFNMVVALSVLLSLAVVDGLNAQAPYRDTPQGPSTTETLRQPTIQSGLTGLLDPSRFNMGHSIGFGYGSAGGQGVSQGYYMNTLSYRFNAPVMLQLRTGVTNNPFAASGGMTQPGQSALSSMFNNAEFFGGADLIWKPRDNMRIQISVDRIPAGMGGYRNYYNPWGRGYMFSDFGYNSGYKFDRRFYVPSGH
ncbi:MAG TPA: hypothetical protein ENH10_02690 [Bacteroidetes bacterium]|nr:hypothetical protein [Bacteroidota bacterium]HEX04048.1 hypothetical protein [Bacteroidota bacterium]